MSSGQTSQGLAVLRERRDARASLNRLFQHPENVCVIHYSCQSFYDNRDGRSPRITSLAVRNLASGQTQSFSIHQMAERTAVDLRDIEKNYDSLELAMLNEFSEFVRLHGDAIWAHWNMRDVNYGFAALEHRHLVLNKDSHGGLRRIEESKKVDLARIFVALYGYEYAGHPRLTSLVQMNNVAIKGFLSGDAEAKAFEAKEYVKLHLSTLRKVDVLANLAGRAHKQQLVVKKNWREWLIYPIALLELAQEHWIVTLVGMIVLAGSFFQLMGPLLAKASMFLGYNP